MSSHIGALLEIRDLTISLPSKADREEAVSDINISLGSNEILCIVGETGSGKSILARSIMGLCPAPHVRIKKGEICFDGRDLVQASASELRALRGNKISMIFQEPMTALNPLRCIGAQMLEVFRVHKNKRLARTCSEVIAESLRNVGLTEAARVLASYPHELSGGQRQRVMIAMALLLKPSILLADEPTTALDVTTQAKILKLIKDIQGTQQMGVMFITHDFGVVAEIADRVAVMRNGRIVELGETRQVLKDPKHEYTKSLISAVPAFQKTHRRREIEMPPALRVENIDKSYPSARNIRTSHVSGVHALRGVSLAIRRGETLGIVGESGSGKTTLAHCVARLTEADSGKIVLGETDLLPLRSKALRAQRKRFQMVFQDPYASLDPRWKVGNLIVEAMYVHGIRKTDARKRVHQLLEIVGLEAKASERYPHEFSGGQRQRICIARALALEPELLIADEPVSALDVSVQARVLELLTDVKARMGLTMMFITHDLRVASQVCDRLCVMQHGQIVEHGSVEDVFFDPRHPYTQELIGAIPGQRYFSDDRIVTSSADGKRSVHHGSNQ